MSRSAVREPVLVSVRAGETISVPGFPIEAKAQITIEPDSTPGLGCFTFRAVNNGTVYGARFNGTNFRPGEPFRGVTPSRQFFLWHQTEKGRRKEDLVAVQVQKSPSGMKLEIKPA